MSTDAVVIWGELLWDRYPAFLARALTSGSELDRDSDSASAPTEEGGDQLGGDQLGGAPANVAWHLAQAGGWARLVTRVGDDADGHRAIARLDGLVDTSLIQIDPDHATGEVTIRIEHGEPRYTLHSGRAWEHIACTSAVLDAIRDAGVFVYGTLAQRTAGGLAEWQRAIAETERSPEHRAKPEAPDQRSEGSAEFDVRGGRMKYGLLEAARALRVYDANLRPNDRATHVIGHALEHADVVKLNDREVAQLRALFDWDDPVARLRGTRPRIVVVTHGAAGSTIYPIDAPPIEIPGVPAASGGDNVGCGDAYLALLMFGMISGWDLAASGRVASRWAAAVAGVRGATPWFEADRIADLLEAA
jgi:fructokinase